MLAATKVASERAEATIEESANLIFLLYWMYRDEIDHRILWWLIPFHVVGTRVINLLPSASDKQRAATGEQRPPPILYASCPQHHPRGLLPRPPSQAHPARGQPPVPGRSIQSNNGPNFPQTISPGSPRSRSATFSASSGIRRRVGQRSRQYRPKNTNMVCDMGLRVLIALQRTTMISACS